MKLFVLLPLLAVGWYAYVSNKIGGTAFLLCLVVASTLLFFAVRRDFTKAAAANNVVAAAVTYELLGPADKARVHQHAIDVVKRSGWRGSREPSFPDEAARFGWYALAMAELGIAPACILSAWNHVRNPFIAISIGDSNIDAALKLASKAGHSVRLSREPSAQRT